MVSKKKKIIVLSVMALLLVATGFLNLTLNNNVITQETGGIVQTGNFFTNSRADRQATRSEEMLYLEAIIASTSSSLEAKQVAENKKIELVQMMETELALEGLIKARGFEEALVTMTNGNAYIVVKDDNLEATDVAQIVDVVKESTGKSIDNIKIIPV